MKKTKKISIVLSLVSVGMTVIGVMLQSDVFIQERSKLKYREVNINNIATSATAKIKDTADSKDVEKVTAVEMDVTPVSIYIPPRVEVYDGLTREELIDKINRNLGSDYMAGKGEIIVDKCLETGVDTYMAVAIILHETGCGSRCSSLTRNCNNVGGQKGSPSCNGGSYKSYPTLDEGIIGFIDNLKRNYYDYGLTTVEAIGRKYAEGATWPSKIHSFMDRIRNS